MSDPIRNINQVLNALSESITPRKARLIRQLCETANVKGTDDIQKLADSLLDSQTFFHWKNYPSSWKTISNHEAAFSALKTVCGHSIMISALGDDTCNKIKDKIKQINRWIDEQSTEFENKKYEKNLVVEKYEESDELESEQVGGDDIIDICKMINLEADEEEELEEDKADDQLVLVADNQITALKKKVANLEFVIKALVDELRARNEPWANVITKMTTKLMEV